MDNIILINNESDFTGHVKEFNPNRPYVVYVNDTDPEVLFYSELVVSPYMFGACLRFDKTYSDVSYNNGELTIAPDSAADEFISVSENGVITFDDYDI